MNKISLFLNKNYFLNIIVLFFITAVFLNHIHNRTDSSAQYEKIDLNHSQDTYVLVKASDLKKELSKELVSNDGYSNTLNRECEVTGDFHDRHKVRWLKALFLKKIFNISYKINEGLPYYINIILHSLIIFFSFIILSKTFVLKRKYNLLFFLYFTFIFQQHLSEYSFSIFETFFFSLSLYASKNKKNFLFLLSCLLAIFNRESGFIIIFSWLIFNNKEYKKLIIFFSISAAIFVLLNYDIFKCIINPKFFVPMENQKGQINFSDLLNINIISTGKLLFTNFMLPFGIGLYYLIATKTKNLPLIALFLVYFLVFVFATPAQHMSVRLILIPLIFTSIYFYNKENKII